MLEKIKSFLIKNKLYVLIASIFLLFILLTIFLVILFSESEEVEDDDKERQEQIGREDTYYEDYDIEISESLVNEIDRYAQSYPTFIVKNVSHLEWVEEFVSATKGATLVYTEKPHPEIPGHDFHTIDQSLHYWEGGGDDIVSYDNATDVLSFQFDVGVNISGISIDPKSEESVKAGLSRISAEFFSGDFTYQIDEISKVGNYYKVDYNRLLNGYPITSRIWDTYLLISPDGRLKEGMFLLAEFEEDSEVGIYSGEFLRENISKPEFSKFLDFELLIEDEILKYGEYGYVPTGQELARINLENVYLEYRYYSKFDEEVKPWLYFEGEGYVEIEGEEINANFEVSTSSDDDF